MKLIDKSALVAEIEKEIKNIYAGREYVGIPYDEECIVRGLIKAEDIINTLEVKEVDLEKEIGEYLSTYWSNEKELHPFLGHIAKHFFELGLKVAQKGE